MDTAYTHTSSSAPFTIVRRRSVMRCASSPAPRTAAAPRASTAAREAATSGGPAGAERKTADVRKASGLQILRFVPVPFGPRDTNFRDRIADDVGRQQDNRRREADEHERKQCPEREEKGVHGPAHPGREQAERGEPADD